MTATTDRQPTPATGAAPAPAAPARLSAEDLSLGYGGVRVVDALSVQIPTGVITAVVGPNGCGKSTLLRGLGRLLAAAGGRVLLDGQDIAATSTREVARTLGILPQSPHAPEGVTVSDLVARGRHPHQRWFRQWSTDDELAVRQALEWTGILELADRPLDTLSGGQRQRAWISMALAQGTDILLLDEPTTFLDVAHAIEVLDLLDRLHEEQGRTVVAVLHDLNLAARYADHLVVLREGAVLDQGHPGDVLTPDLLDRAFGLRAQVVPDPASGRPWVIPIGTRHVLRP